jgi:hypothetical protein
MKTTLLIPTVLSAALLAACGGGGDGASTTTGTGAGTGSGTTTPAALTLSGVAATGAAIAGKTVDAKCASGTGTATSNADGSYTISVTSGSLPCVLKVTPASGPALYSVATGSGSTATANISPVTQLVVASLTGTDPDAYFGAFDATAAAAVTPAKVSTAVAAVKTTLAAAGLDLGSIDVLAGTLTPATSTATGNAYDQALDALAARLAASGTSLSGLTTTVAAASATSTPTVAVATSGNASLPAELLLKPAASNCASLRSGVYRVVHPIAAASLADQTSRLSIDAATLAVVDDYGTAQAGTSSWTANGACRYTADNGKTDIVVSPAGVIVARYFDSAANNYKAAIAFPEQTHTLAELEGGWNLLGMEYDSGTAAYIGNTVSATFSATGTVSNVSACQDSSTWSVATCVTIASGLPSYAANADGGFDSIDAGATVASGRTFAYRSGSGDLMLVNVDGDGSFDVRTRQRTIELPAVGRVNTSWDIQFTNKWLGGPALSESTNTVTAVDSVASSFTRLAKTVGGTDEHVETVLVNSPRNGYNYRAAATVTGTDGTTVVNVSEWNNLPVRGMGFSALLRPGQKRFMFSVQQ